MEKIYEGKSKDVFKRDDGNIEFHFKDAATGKIVNGKPVFDPGCDSVAGEIEGKGIVSCKFTTFFFQKLKEKGIPNHYVETKGERVIVAKPAELPRVEGLYNLEFVYRNNAYGSFLRRYPFVPFCKELGGLIEITTKGKTDHLINEDSLIKLGILSEDDLKEAKELMGKVFAIIKEELAKKGLHLIDGKIEIGKIDGKMCVIDDISPDVMRVCRKSAIEQTDKNPEGWNEKNVLKPHELYEIMMGNSESAG